MHFYVLTLTTLLQGKTASLLSATISWLLDDHERAKKGHLAHVATSDCKYPLEFHIRKDSQPWPVARDWVAAQALSRRRRELEAEEGEYQERLLRARKREEAMKRIAGGRAVKRQVCSLALEEAAVAVLTCERNLPTQLRTNPKTKVNSCRMILQSKGLRTTLTQRSRH